MDEPRVIDFIVEWTDKLTDFYRELDEANYPFTKDELEIMKRVAKKLQHFSRTCEYLQILDEPAKNYRLTLDE